MWRISRLETITAANTSTASVPRPSISACQLPANGTTRVEQPHLRVGVERTAVPTCSARKTTASSEMLRCSDIVAKRGSVGSEVLRDVRTPSTTTPVSSSSEVTPLPRIRYQTARRSSGGLLAASRRCRRPRRRGGRGGPRARVRASQAGACLAEHDRGGARGVRVDAGRGGDARRPPDLGRRAARARIDDVVALDAVGAPAAHASCSRSRARRCAARSSGPRRRGRGGRRSRARAIRRAGGVPATAMSPPRLTSTPLPSSSAMRRAARSAANALPVAPRSSSTPRGMRIVRRSRSSRTCRQLVGAPAQAHDLPPSVVGPDQGEVAVVAERAERAADRGVDGARSSPRPRAARSATASKRTLLTPTGAPAPAFTAFSSEVGRKRLHARSIARAPRAGGRPLAGAPTRSATVTWAVVPSAGKR